MTRKLWVAGAVTGATALLVGLAGGFLDPGSPAPHRDDAASRASDAPAAATSSTPAVAAANGAETRDDLGSDAFAGPGGDIDPLDYEIEGRVVDAKGAPVAGAQVRLVVATGQIPAPSALELYRDAGLVRSEERRVTGREGRFRFRGVHADDAGYLLVAWTKGSAPAWRNDLVVSAGAACSAGDLVLQQGAEIAGRVFEPAGTAAKNARVAVVPAPSAAPVEKFLAVADPDVAGAADEEGRFSVADLPDGRYVVIAWAPGLARGVSAPITVARDAPSPPQVDLLLGPGAAIGGKVATPDGLDLAGVRVLAKIRAAESSDGGVSYDLPVAAETDGSGSFLLDGLLHGRQYDLSASLRGYQNASANAPAGMTSMRLTMRPDLKVRGVVIDAETQKPVSGARVAVYRGKPEDLRPTDLLAAKAGAAADGSGRFLAGDPGKPGQARAIAWARGYAPALSEPFTLSEKGDPPETSVALTRGATLSGRVVAGAEGAPVAGASVAVLSQGRGKNASWTLLDRVTAGPDGRYEAAGLAPGAYVLEARHPGFGAARAEPTTVAQGDRREGFDVALPVAAGINGMVLTGGVDVGARVTAIREDGLLSFAVTDAESRFSLTKLGPGRYSLRADKLPSLDEALLNDLRPPPRRPTGPGWTPVDVPEGRVVDVTLELAGADAGRVIGTVVHDGRPGSAFTVVLTRESSDRPRPLPRSSDGNPTFGQNRTTTSDVQGSFEFPAVPAGIYRIFAVPRGRSTAPRNVVAADTVQVLGGATARRDLFGRTGALRGRVTRTGGSAVSGAQVSAVVNGTRSGSSVLPAGTSFRTKTGGGGGFDFGSVPAGAYDLTVEASGMPRKTVAADVDSAYAEPLVIQLDAPGTSGKKPGR